MNKKFAVLASGAGTTLDFLLTNQKLNNLKHQLTLLVTNNPAAGALDVARRFQLKTAVVPLTTANFSFEAWDLALLKTLQAHEIDFVFLIGFLKKVGPAVLKHYAGQIYNSHPSLLPKHGGKGLYGAKVAQAVLAARETETGVTIHLVDGEYDNGKILKQLRVAVKPEDGPESLESRVKEHEKRAILDFINAI